MGDFKEENGKTRAGLFIKGLGKIIPDVLDIATSGSPLEMLAKAKELIINKPGMKQEDKDIVLAKIETEKEIEIARLQDMDSARNREIKMAEAGKADWLMKAVGVTVLFLLVTCVYSVIFIDLRNESLAHLIIGEVLGFGGGMIFYYFGTSKSSADKNILLKNSK